MRTTVKLGFVAATFLFFLFERELFADTLYKKKAAIAIGFGSTARSKIDWTDCSRGSNEKYIKPPYWVSKGDNCRLKASQFGLGPSGERYVANDTRVSSRFFPDARRGEFIDFQNDSAKGLLVLTYRVRSLRLPYAAPPTLEQLVWNELSTAEGFANLGQPESAKDLEEDVNGALQGAPARSFSTESIVGASVSLFRVKATMPSLSTVSHSALLRLAYLRTTLEPEPQIPPGPPDRSCDLIRGEDLSFSHNIYRFGEGNPCGLALGPGPDGKMPNRIYIGNSVIQGGTHVLDGIQWDHDTFVGSHIQYRGAAVFVNKVLFINCTFDIVDSPNGDRVIDYAISRLPRLAIENEVGFEGPATYNPRAFVSSVGNPVEERPFRAALGAEVGQAFRPGVPVWGRLDAICDKSHRRLRCGCASIRRWTAIASSSSPRLRPSGGPSTPIDVTALGMWSLSG